MRAAPEKDELLAATAATFQQLLQVHERTALAAVVDLENERARLRELFEHLPASVAILSGPDHVFEFVNGPFLDTTGRPPDDVLGRPVRDVFPELGSQGYFDLLDSVYASGEIVNAHEQRIEFVRTPGGPIEEGFYSYSWIPLRDVDGETTGIVAFSFDVTDLVVARRRTEELLRNLTDLSSASLEIASHLSVTLIAETVLRRTSEIVTATAASLELADSPEMYVWPKQPSPPKTENMLSTPLLGRDRRLLGVLTVWLDRASTEVDAAVLTQIGSVAGVAIANATRFEQEHSIALKLQRSLLPEGLPSVAGLDVAVRYVPGGTAEQVGGDWYDVMTLADGTTIIVMGDVSGRGIEAATVMGQLRMGLRAYALAGNPPSTVLERTDALLQSFDRPGMATVVYVAISPDRSTLTICSAGHPPPVLVDAAGRARLIQIRPGAPLGATSFATFDTYTEPFPPGSTLVLYTDGLIERRHRSIDEGFEALLAASSKSVEAAEQYADELLTTMLRDAELPDDVALLVASASKAKGSSFAMNVPAVPASVSRLRRALTQWLQSESVGDDDTFEIGVAVAEACSNAVHHAGAFEGSVVEIVAERIGDLVSVVVKDRGRWRSSRSSGGGRGLKIIRGFMSDVEMKRAPSGTEVRMVRQLTRVDGR